MSFTIFANLTEEQKERFKNCKTSEELKKVLDEEGIELTTDQLDAVAGGGCSPIGGSCDCDDRDCKKYNW